MTYFSFTSCLQFVGCLFTILLIFSSYPREGLYLVPDLLPCVIFDHTEGLPPDLATPQLRTESVLLQESIHLCLLTHRYYFDGILLL